MVSQVQFLPSHPFQHLAVVAVVTVTALLLLEVLEEEVVVVFLVHLEVQEIVVGTIQ
jgi:hypothetical protein